MSQRPPRRRRLRWLSLAFAGLGAAALVWLAGHIGIDRLAAGVTAVGWGFALTASAHLTGLLLDSITLRACAASAGRDVPYLHYAKTSVAGHAINEATPLGKLGEVTKYAILAQRLSPQRSAAALIVQNVIMFVTNCGLIAVAAPLAVVILPVADVAVLPFLAAGAVFAVLGAGGLVLLGRGVGDGPVRLLGRLGVSAERVSRWRDGWQHIQDHWRDAARDRRAMLTAWGSAILSRGANVLEGGIVLFLLGADHVVLGAVLSLAGSQLVFWLTSFVPLQTGTAEGGTYLVFRAAGLTPEHGVVIELVRKVRRLSFIALGVLVLTVQSARGGDAGREPG